MLTILSSSLWQKLNKFIQQQYFMETKIMCEGKYNNHVRRTELTENKMMNLQLWQRSANRKYAIIFILYLNVIYVSVKIC